MKMREDGHRGLFAAEPGLAGQVVLDVEKQARIVIVRMSFDTQG